MKSFTAILLTALAAVSVSATADAQGDDIFKPTPTYPCHARPTITQVPPNARCRAPVCTEEPRACPLGMRIIYVPCDCPTGTVTRYACPTGCPRCPPNFTLAHWDCKKPKPKNP